MEAFRDCLADRGLADLGFSGYPYTWDNKRDEQDNIQVRLDRATCTDSFLSMFPETKVEHILTEESDHQALLVRVLETAPSHTGGGPRLFCFEEAWIRHEKYEEMIVEAWDAANSGEEGLAAVWQKLGSMAGSMQRWEREVFGSIRKKIKLLKAQLLEAKERALSTGYQQEVRDIEEQLREVYEREEIMYRRRSRVDWLKAGDQNTQYFQNRASHRKGKNTVKRLQRDDGSLCTTDDDMRAMVATFYENLFTSEGFAGADDLLQNIQKEEETTVCSQVGDDESIQ
ncbi:uncharacterized protein [Aegilops tauschii subsp. strangulata]|uniref:uncharacterized protein n=1 Tax=Aegilops tauschii subsp. strangulata TaxID=200361 RepID=UPI003CC89847